MESGDGYETASSPYFFAKSIQELHRYTSCYDMYARKEIFIPKTAYCKARRSISITQGWRSMAELLWEVLEGGSVLPVHCCL